MAWMQLNVCFEYRGNPIWPFWFRRASARQPAFVAAAWQHILHFAYCKRAYCILWHSKWHCTTRTQVLTAQLGDRIGQLIYSKRTKHWRDPNMMLDLIILVWTSRALFMLCLVWLFLHQFKLIDKLFRTLRLSQSSYKSSYSVLINFQNSSGKPSQWVSHLKITTDTARGLIFLSLEKCSKIMKSVQRPLSNLRLDIMTLPRHKIIKCLSWTQPHGWSFIQKDIWWWLHPLSGNTMSKHHKEVLPAILLFLKWQFPLLVCFKMFLHLEGNEIFIPTCSLKNWKLDQPLVDPFVTPGNTALN